MNAALRRLSSVLAYAESLDWRPVDSNPCRGVQHFKEPKRTRYLNAEELKRLGKVLEAEEVQRAKKDKEKPARWSRSARLLVELLLFTGLRPGEVLAMRWEDIDQEKGLLRLPDAKTGARTVALSEVAMQVLKDWPGIEGNPWVIPGKRKGTHLANPGKPWGHIRKEAGLEDVHLHDLRHTHAPGPRRAASRSTWWRPCSDTRRHRPPNAMPVSRTRSGPPRTGRPRDIRLLSKAGAGRSGQPRGRPEVETGYQRKAA